MHGSFVRNQWRKIFMAISLLTDVVAMILSGLAAFWIGQMFPAVFEWNIKEVLYRWIQFSSILIFFALMLGVYRGAYHVPVTKQYLLALRSLVYSVVVVFASFYVFHTRHFPRRFTFLFFMLLPIFFLAGRALLNRFNLATQKKGFGIHNTLIYGLENGHSEIFERFESMPELGYHIKGVIAKNGSTGERYPIYPFSQLQDVLKQQNIDRIFLPSTRIFTEAVPELMKICKNANVVLKTVSPEADDLLRTAKVYDLMGITLYAPPRVKSQYIQRTLKRSFDILASAFLICLFSPILVLTALLILLETGRPIIFRQNRSRLKNGKSFDLYKFRSMIHKADELKDRLYELNESDGALFKLREDPRVTRVGKVIRRLSIDELPQLFNVLKGDMSLVGPRPLPVSDFDKVNEGPDFWEAIRERESVRPGITGLWQISGRSNLGFREMVLLDLYYIENQSFLFDLEILFETMPVMLFGKGAY